MSTTEARGGEHIQEGGDERSVHFRASRAVPNVSKEETLPPSTITDIFPHGPGDPNPFWEHPEDIPIIMNLVRAGARHLYPPPELPETYDVREIVNKEYLLRDYLLGFKSSEGNVSKPSDSTVFRGVTQEGKLASVSKVVWRGMSFIPEGKGIGYAERQVSILEGRGVGTVHAAYVLEYAFRIHDGYKGHGANEMRTSEILTPEDPEGAERKHRLILRVGYLPDKEPKKLPDGRYVQPYKMTRERYEEVRPTLLPLLAFAKDRIMP